MSREVITAGIVGFKKGSKYSNVFNALYKAGLDGDCLGYSKTEFYKSKGPNKTNIVRNCKMFRHDTTLLSILAPKLIPNIEVQPVVLFGDTKKDVNQFLHNFRLNYFHLNYIKKPFVNNFFTKYRFYYTINRMWINIFILLKGIRHKKLFFKDGEDVLDSIFGNIFLTELHSYPSNTSNIRYYHLLKARIIKKFILSHKKADNRMRILDVGAGLGPYSRIASNIFDEVFYDEYNTKEYEQTKNKLSTFNNIKFNNNNITNLPYIDNYFDSIICSEVLEHVPNRLTAIKELKRVLKPGGKLLLSMPQKNSLFYHRSSKIHKNILNKNENELTHEDWEFVQHFKFSSKDIRNLVEDEGLLIISTSGANVLPIGEKIFSKLYFKNYIALFLYINFELLLEKMIPNFASFYFIEAAKKQEN